MAPRKIDLALTMRKAISDFDDLVAMLNELINIYEASGYDPAGSDPIEVEDLEGHDMTPGNLNAVRTFVNNVNLFLNDGEPMQFDYASAIDAFRSMPGQEE